MAATAQASPLMNDKREIFGWTMYDWANSAFSTTVVTVFLGPYLTAILQGIADAGGFVYPLGIAVRFDSFFAFCVSISVGLQVFILPVLGAIADYTNLRKQMMMLFSTLGGLSTVLLFFLTEDTWLLGGLLFILANLSFGAGIVFYNAFLPDIASEGQQDAVSSRGFALGYAGGGLLLLVNLVMFQLMEDGALAARLSILSAGLWWLGFSIITFRTLRPRRAVRQLPAGQSALTVTLRQLSGTLRELLVDPVPPAYRKILLAAPVTLLLLVLFWLKLLPAAVIYAALTVDFVLLLVYAYQLPHNGRFLVAYLLYNDGIQTVIVVATIFGQQELGMKSTNLILVILMVQAVAFVGAYLFAWLAKRLDTKRAVVISLFVWSALVVYAFVALRTEIEFWVLSAIVALVLGGSQALSRSLWARMIPAGREAEYFSFYEVSERGTSWMGPFLFGAVNQAFHSLRLGILSLIFFFVVGLVLLGSVNVGRAMRESGRAEAVVGV